MIAKSEREQIIALINREVVPAIGCTEPIAVALCVAKATETLGKRPEKIKVRALNEKGKKIEITGKGLLAQALSHEIPGTGMIGLPIAIALGALIGKSEYQLEVLKDSTPEAVEEGKKLIDSQAICIGLKKDIDEKLYIEIICEADNDKATAIISGGHTNFIYVSHNNDVILNKQATSSSEEEQHEPELNLRKVYDFATTTPLEEIRFILETKRLNKNAAERSFQGNYGHQLGKILKESKSEKQLLGSNTFTHILSYTSAACDARMAGAMIPVMSNSGSGNQGITATLPVVVYAEDNHKSEEELIRALVLSHLTVIYIKQSLGRLSALCGCVVAATGSSCGITYLMGGNYEQITFAVQNMIANITGMICDGAKPSCALKLTSGVSTAVFSAILAMEHKCVSSVEGIIDDNVDRSIRNLTKIGSQGMNETDKLVLEIMTHKQCD
jgi:L-cysteine desulfidase